MATNFQSAKNRIHKAKTGKDLTRLERSFERIYNAGALTENEFMRLDALIVDKLILLEN